MYIQQLSRFHPDNRCDLNETIYVKHLYSSCKRVVCQNHCNEIAHQKLHSEKCFREHIVMGLLNILILK